MSFLFLILLLSFNSVNNEDINSTEIHEQQIIYTTISQPTTAQKAEIETEIPDIIDLDAIKEENTSLSENKSSGYVVQYTLDSRETYNPEESTKSVTYTTTVKSNEEEDTSWVSKAVKDIAYYIRAYRFKEYDRRYNLKPPVVLGQYFSAFPKPPLRSLHWEVHKYCDVSFIQCVKYLGGKIKDVILRREDDTVYIIKDMNWTFDNNPEEIESINSNCKNFSEIEFTDATPFEGPLERYQWKTTASYFMCWFTMMEEPTLKHFNESCDNFADCLSEFGSSNRDPRANDEEPFACAMYSFCPDPCCPIRHITDTSDCFASNVNPCFLENQMDSDKQMCSIKRNGNQDFRDIILNRFNVSCNCPKAGFVWESKYGFCVDVDECAAGKHNCAKEKEVCVNTVGGFKCACNWGYIWDEAKMECKPSDALSVLIKEKEYKKMVKEQPEVTLSVFKFIYRWVSGWFVKSSN